MHAPGPHLKQPSRGTARTWYLGHLILLFFLHLRNFFPAIQLKLSGPLSLCSANQPLAQAASFRLCKPLPVDPPCRAVLLAEASLMISYVFSRMLVLENGTKEDAGHRENAGLRLFASPPRVVLMYFTMKQCFAPADYLTPRLLLSSSRYLLRSPWKRARRCVPSFAARPARWL